MSSATFNTNKVLPQVKSVELRAEGATITLLNGQTVYLNQDQITKVWGMMTLALDCACFGELSSMIRRRGIGQVMTDSLHGLKALREEENENQHELPLEAAVNESR